MQSTRLLLLLLQLLLLGAVQVSAGAQECANLFTHDACEFSIQSCQWVNNRCVVRTGTSAPTPSVPCKKWDMKATCMAKGHACGFVLGPKSTRGAGYCVPKCNGTTNSTQCGDLQGCMWLSSDNLCVDDCAQLTGFPAVSDYYACHKQSACVWLGPGQCVPKNCPDFSKKRTCLASYLKCQWVNHKCAVAAE